MNIRVVLLGLLLLGVLAGILVFTLKSDEKPPISVGEESVEVPQPRPEPPVVETLETVPEKAPEPATAPAPDAKAKPEGASVTGIVRTAAGLPVKDAKVRAFTRRSPFIRKLESFQARSRTDESGRFSFDSIDPAYRYVLVEVEATGFYRDAKSVKLGESVAFVLGLPGVLRGRVTVAGEGMPCAGATVSLSGGRVVASMKATTDADGLYRIENVKPDTYRVFVMAKDQPFSFPRISVVIQSGRETVGNFEVKKGLVLRGRVVEAETRVPIRGARIKNEFGMPKKEIQSDEDGRFVLAPLGEHTRLRIMADGYVTRVEPITPAPRKETGSEVVKEYSLTRAASVQGRVFDPDGQPVAGARVRVTGLSPTQTVRTESGEDGGFHLKSVPVGVAVRLVAQKKGLARVLSDFMTLRAGESRMDLVFRLGRGAVVSGRLTDTDGAPITQGRVHLNSRSGYGRQNSASPDKDGNYRIEAVPAGRYSLEVRVKDFVGQKRPDFVAEEGGEYSGVNFVLVKGLTLTGVVVDQSGRPVGAASVHAYLVSPQKDQIRGNKSGRTDAVGRFTLTSLSPGPHGLIVHKQGYKQENRGVQFQAGAQDVVVKMIKHHEGIAGHVVRQDTGAPVSLFFVRCYHGPRSFVKEFTDQEGRFRIKDLTQGVYHLEAGTRDGLISPRAERVELRDGSGPVQIELFVGAGVVLTGRVDSPDRKPLDRARVEVCRVDGEPAGVMGYAVTDAEGGFEIDALVPGAYRVRASHVDWIEVEQTVTVRRGKENQVVLQVAAQGGIIEITVKDSGGRPVEGASPTVKRPDGVVMQPDSVKYNRLLQERKKVSPDLDYRTFTRRQYRTDDQGVIERRFLPAGRFLVEVRKIGYRTVRVDAESHAGVTTRLAVTLVPEK